jgi:hypothetical protein
MVQSTIQRSGPLPKAHIAVVVKCQGFASDSKEIAWCVAWKDPHCSSVRACRRILVIFRICAIRRGSHFRARKIRSRIVLIDADGSVIVFTLSRAVVDDP